MLYFFLLKHNYPRFYRIKMKKEKYKKFYNIV